MPEYFVDTWFFIATLDRFDSHHRTALQLRTRYRQRLVTHDGVLTEMLAYFSSRGREARLEAVRIARESVLEMQVIPSDRRLVTSALQLFEDRPDKGYSLVDCMSMVVMRQRGIRHVITNDHHFEQEGFVRVNA